MTARGKVALLPATSTPLVQAAAEDATPSAVAERG